jgi:hypothetical protein
MPNHKRQSDSNTHECKKILKRFVQSKTHRTWQLRLTNSYLSVWHFYFSLRNESLLSIGGFRRQRIGLLLNLGKQAFMERHFVFFMVRGLS